MIKLLGSNPWHGNAIFGVLRTLFYSTEALASCSPPFETLYHRISRAGNPRVSIVPVLDQWVEEGRDVNKSELQSFVKMLRKYRRYSHALQISEWMSDARNYDLSHGDIAIRLDLISKVCGLEQAEMYFNSLPDPLRNFKVYGALLFCSVEHKSLEKAENLFEKMKELGYVKGPLPYNVMLTLYSQLGQHEKLDILVKEMEEKVIDYDSFTLKIQLNLYANTSDIDRMEKLLMKIEADPLVTVDWNGYVVAAKGFLKAGLLEKASSMLRRSSNSLAIKQEHLLMKSSSVYTLLLGIKRRFTVFGICTNLWPDLKIPAIFLDDIDGAEMILEEWESGAKFFDIRIPNFLITTYCKKGLLVKAESYINKLEESGKPLDASTWTRLAAGYHMHGQMAKAVETMKRAILASQPGWELNHLILAACLEYLKEKGNLEVAHELLSLIRERDHFSEELCDKLEKYII
ncbi:Tetratricopeptide repeat-like superfamily protein [Prunus dulcis]|uniref:Tetratricopeptide repeat-like superfamily protein n=1 Tax=Prunus dulcis TaxID=3755 RepID=A0A4Y1R687_PRUDU|nr:Tetratricopeptide repeat-like superfamily protein [Prunus dulcis]